MMLTFDPWISSGLGSIVEAEVEGVHQLESITRRNVEGFPTCGEYALRGVSRVKGVVGEG